MKIVIRALSLLALAVAMNVASAAESKAVQSMAGILAGFQHMPSAEAKTTLAKIADDKAATADEKTIAKAIANVQHTANAADKPALEAIVANAKATAGTKALAGILLSMKHFPSAEDKTKLAALAQ